MFEDPAQGVGVALSGGAGGKVAAPHHALHPEGVPGHLEQRRHRVELELGEKARGPGADFAQTRDLDTGVVALAVAQGPGKIGVGRLVDAGAGEVLEDDVGAGAGVENPREVGGGELGYIAEAGDHEAELAGPAPHIIGTGVDEAAVRGDANAGRTLLGEAGEVADGIGRLGIDQDRDLESARPPGGLLEEVGVVVGSAVLDEHRLVNAVAVHLQFQDFDGLEPALTGVAVGVDYEHLKLPSGIRRLGNWGSYQILPNSLTFAAMITLSNLGKFYGDRTLFAQVSIQLNAGERYGLVGANGSGKTTFLNILAGALEPGEGEISIPQRLRTGVLNQDQFLYEDEKILNVALMGNAAFWAVKAEKEQLLARAEEHFDADRFAELEEAFLRFDGYSAEARAGTILEGLGLPAHLHHNPLSTLSGGFKLRVLLAQVLASAPDVLLLDEPTNHLDILSIRWLETFLRDFAGVAVVISHDHRFLDNISTCILDIDYETVQLYHGDYSAFVKAKLSERSRREKEIVQREREMAHHQQFVDRFRAKARKARQAQNKLRLIEKMEEEMVELPKSSRRYPVFRFEQRRKSGRDVLALEGVGKAFGDNEVLHGVDLLVQRGDRVAIMGPNGIGKSTLLKIAMGELAPNEGTVEWGYEAHPGYFAQDHRTQLSPPGRTAEEWVWDCCQDQGLGFVRGRMGQVLFSGDDGKKPLQALSGGEAARLVFCRLAITRPNALVLDEPTNHLDLESIEALVAGLKDYPGTLIIVSHDRWFISQLATRVVEIKPGEVLDFRGTYEEYVHFCGDDHLDADRVVLKAKRAGKKKKGSGPAPVREPRSAGKSKNVLRRAVARQEERMLKIAEAEARIAEIDALRYEPDHYAKTPPEQVKALESERAYVERTLAALLEEWERAEEEISAAPEGRGAAAMEEKRGSPEVQKARKSA